MPAPRATQARQLQNGKSWSSRLLMPPYDTYERFTVSSQGKHSNTDELQSSFSTLDKHIASDVRFLIVNILEEYRCSFVYHQKQAGFQWVVSLFPPYVLVAYV